MEILTEEESIKNYLPIFATEAYLRALSDEYGWFMAGKYILPYIIKKKNFLNIMYFTNETIVLGETASIIEEEKQFLNEVVMQTRKMGVHIIAQPQTNVVFFTYPEGSLYAPFGSYRIDLTQKEEDLFSKMHSKHRNVVRKAERDGVKILSGPELCEECCQLINETMLRQKLPQHDKEQILRFKKELKDNLAFYVARHEGIAQGAAIIPWNEKAAYYLYGGSRERPHTGAINLMHWRIMLEMKARGVKVYDLMGARLNPVKDSKYEGIQMFKERFGGELKRGYLWKYPIHHFHYNLYRIMTTLRRYVKGGQYSGDIIDQEKRCDEK